ncbi:adenine phosphoribosyltransferase [Ureaplasma zalophigenitalium]|uniref:Adenine phosphoribosyltransferase n=1 Tax=Ureaplasma zalophigenitalium TaxID=907723 RepID=A0ABT3BPL6_9BACT|nr:adenine phosphoribosyltransferase [Ureaplasma zalophigenitalium]MCV3754176.1 adenine phosphoribosyltransferase [Ureaplasma zalophigenitalium]
MPKIEYVKSLIKDVPDFPKKGIIFKDITPIFMHPQAMQDVIDAFAEYVNQLNVDVIVGAESRGFLFGLPLAMQIKKPFILVRKPNKLPREHFTQEYELEYGSSSLEMHKDAIQPNQRVLIVDDLLATGGTVHAIEELVKKAQGQVVGSVYLIELTFLNGHEKLSAPTFSLIKY